MWCHKCNSEFRVDVTTCPTCEVALHEAPPTEPEEIDEDQLLDSETELTVVGHGEFASVMELRRAFHAASIPVAIVREEVDPDAPVEARRQVRFEVLIPTDRLEDAARVLAERSAEALRREGLQPLAPGDDTGHCPACGAVVSESVTECADCGIALG